MRLNELFKNSGYDYSLFSSEAIDCVESAIYMKETKKGEVPHIKCLVRKKEIRLTPEEAVMKALGVE